MEYNDKSRRTNNRRVAEIDTSAPFQSVKEAVILFGERVLAGEIIANKLKQLQKEGNTEADHVSSENESMRVELEETKQNLENAKDESILMATYLSSLQQELERTKRELQQLKEQELEKQLQPEADEDVKHVEENAVRIFEEKMSHEKVEFQKKKYVTFGNPQSLTETHVVPPGDAVLERHPSLRKKKKKPLLPLISLIFSKKKGSTSEVATV